MRWFAWLAETECDMSVPVRYRARGLELTLRVIGANSLRSMRTPLRAMTPLAPLLFMLLAGAANAVPLTFQITNTGAAPWASGLLTLCR